MTLKQYLFLTAALVCAFLSAGIPQKAAAQEVSVRTNLLWDAVSEPNLGLEIATGEHWSVGVDAGLKAWPRYLAWDWDMENPTHWRNFAVVPEVRYYFNEVFRGFFTGADFIYTHYNIGAVEFPLGLYPETKDNRLQGSFWAGGTFLGYAWWPWQHWRLELEAGVAAGLAAYDRYDCPHCGTKLGEERKVGVVPKLALNVAYNPVSREKHQTRKPSQVVVSGRDTITVLTPPVAFVVQLRDLAEPQTRPDSVARENDWFIPIGKYRPLDYSVRPGRDSLMYVNFPLDSDVLKREFPLKPVKDLHRNAKVLDQIQKAVEVARDAQTTEEILVSVVGLASIEGPRERNDSLSVRRARAVAAYLRERTGLEARQFEVIGKGEAWDWFKAQLEAIPDGGEGLSAGEVAKLLNIIQTEADPDVRERKMKADEKLYRKVADGLLADQRNSGYIRIYYGNKPDEVKRKWNGRILDQMKAKNYSFVVKAVQEDKALLQRVHEDPEAANAYAVALYFTALDQKDEEKEQEALALLEQAARKGSEAAAHNLEGARKYGPARKEYEAWKELMNE